MSFDAGSLLRLIGDTLRDPSEVARRIRGFDFGLHVSWSVLVLATALIVLVMTGERVLFPAALPAEEAALFVIALPPLVEAGLFCGLSALLAYILAATGRSFGGDGDFSFALALMGWFQCLVFVLLIGQVLTALVLPALVGFYVLGSFIAQIVVLLNFINVLHRFDNMFKAAGVLLVSIVATGFGMGLVIVLLAGLFVGNLG